MFSLGTLTFASAAPPSGLHEIDYMEYASDATAETAYVTNSGNVNAALAGTGSMDGAFYAEYGNPLQLNNGVLTDGCSMGNSLTGGDHTIGSVYITSIPSSSLFNITYYYSFDGGSSNHTSECNIGVSLYYGGDWHAVDSYWIGVGVSLSHTVTGTWTGVTAVQLSVSMTDVNEEGIMSVHEIQAFGVKALQSYSEATLKTHGSYSLKGVAAITDSLNTALTRTFS